MALPRCNTQQYRGQQRAPPSKAAANDIGEIRERHGRRRRTNRRGRTPPTRLSRRFRRSTLSRSQRRTAGAERRTARMAARTRRTIGVVAYQHRDDSVPFLGAELGPHRQFDTIGHNRSCDSLDDSGASAGQHAAGEIVATMSCGTLRCRSIQHPPSSTAQASRFRTAWTAVHWLPYRPAPSAGGARVSPPNTLSGRCRP